MDSSKLKVLISAVETATFSAAGEELGFTQAGVSYIIKTLEDELGIQLLIRGKKGVRLTQKGEALMEHVRNADAAMDALLSRAEALKNAQTGRLKIGAEQPFRGVAALSYRQLLRGQPGYTDRRAGGGHR